MGDFYTKESSKNLRKLRQLKPETFKAFGDFSAAVYKDGALSSKIKNVIAIAAAHVTQCPWCIDVHTNKARELGATDEEIAEAIFVAMEIRAGGAFSHAVIALADSAEQHQHS
jgi:AhpD family alkylhydroperoxidase